jgi:predicted transglutaminase-like cysteine proteinase
MPADKDFTESPAGFGDFCRRFSDQCYLPPGRPTSVALTPVIWQQIQLVNANVNHAIWPQDDLSHYGRAEYWTIPVDGFGDCEDYALTKRRDLARLGIPLGALRIAIVITPTAERHAVLDVVTNQGDLVLDNLADTVLSWNRTEFRWIERQDGLTSANWVSLRSANRMATAGTGREALSIASTNVPQL